MVEESRGKRDMSWVTSEIFTRPEFMKFFQFLPDFESKDFDKPEVLKKNIELIRRKSSILGEVINNRGGWLFPEKVYLLNPTYLTRAPEHDEKLDQFLIERPMCYSLNHRFRFLTQEVLPKYLSDILQKKERVRIASFGSGTGRDILTVMGKSRGDIKADMYDIDGHALAEGRKIAEEMGLEKKVNYICQDLAKINNGLYDIGLLIGIICPLSDTLSKRVLRSVRRHIDKGGYLIVSSSSDKMEKGDPSTRFIIEYLANWFLQFRNSDRIEEITESGGYRIIDNNQEPSGYHRISVSQPRD